MLWPLDHCSELLDIKSACSYSCIPLADSGSQPPIDMESATECLSQEATKNLEVLNRPLLGLPRTADHMSAVSGMVKMEREQAGRSRRTTTTPNLFASGVCAL